MEVYKYLTIQRCIICVDKLKMKEPQCVGVFEEWIISVVGENKIAKLCCLVILINNAKRFEPELDGCNHVFTDSQIDYSRINVKGLARLYKIVAFLQPHVFALKGFVSRESIFHR